MLGINHVASRIRSLLSSDLLDPMSEASAFGAMTRGTVGGRAVELMFRKDGTVRPSKLVRAASIVRVVYAM